MANRGDVQNGDEVEDTITGFKGVVIAVTEWLNGCQRVHVQPRTLQESGKPVEAESFDVEQVKVTKASPRRAVLAPTGGPHDPPKRQATPPRRSSP